MGKKGIFGTDVKKSSAFQKALKGNPTTKGAFKKAFKKFTKKATGKEWEQIEPIQESMRRMAAEKRKRKKKGWTGGF